MKRLQYLVRVNKDAGSDWGASVPDLPGCVATGKTVDAALRRIERAIELHLRDYEVAGVSRTNSSCPVSGDRAHLSAGGRCAQVRPPYARRSQSTIRARDDRPTECRDRRGGAGLGIRWGRRNRIGDVAVWLDAPRSAAHANIRGQSPLDPSA